MKHDAHVRTAWMQFFPVKFFLFSIFAFFVMGLMFGQIWAFNRCYDFYKSLLG